MNLTEWRALTQRPLDRSRLLDILVNKINLKRPPVAVTYCDGAPPAGYEPARVPVCSILYHAEQGRKIYVDAEHHDCLVGQYHLGLLSAEAAGRLICDGEYLTMAQGFFTPEAARRNKQQSHSLPTGTITAIAAAPLADLPADVPLDLLCLITDVPESDADRRRGQRPGGHAAAWRAGTFIVLVAVRSALAYPQHSVCVG